jgi:hypothetical protein
MQRSAVDSGTTRRAAIASAAVAILCALSLSALSPDAATARGESCGSPPGGFKNVRVKHMGCEKGLEIARLSFTTGCIHGGCTVRGFRCNAKHGEMSCRKGRKKVKYGF